jgi:uncharacterized phage protein (TIGR02218 family)
MPAPPADPRGRVPRNVQAGYSTGDLLAHLREVPSTLAVCYKLTTVDLSVSLGYTTHTRDLLLPGHAGVAFSSARGLAPLNISQQAGAATPNSQLEALFVDDAITPAKVDAGLFDAAEEEIFLVNYKNVAMGELLLLAGPIGQVQVFGKRFRAEALGRSAALAQAVGLEVSPTCRVVTFGDFQCKRDLTALTRTHTVAALPGGLWTFQASAEFTYTDDLLAFGTAEFLSGNNVSLGKFPVRTNVANLVTLELPVPFAMQVGDSVRLIEGCDRTAARCKALANMVNFHGEDGISQIEGVNRVNSAG